MSSTQDPVDFFDQIATQLPYLRRYARALTGSQSSGDTYAIATLKTLLEDRSMFAAGDMPINVGLFKCFHAIWSSAGALVAEDDAEVPGRAQDLLANLAPNTREALLLSTIEGFSITDIAVIMDLSRDEVRGLVTTARKGMEGSSSGRIPIIEDEPIIAAYLSAIVTDLGHTVTAIARTHSEAVEKGAADKPDLILADIQLADNSSGIDAVNDLLKDLGDTPVIFITAFPERLLTGTRPEPAFLIAKPYKEAQVESAVSQAMFFASTETLHR